MILPMTSKSGEVLKTDPAVGMIGVFIKSRITSTSHDFTRLLSNIDLHGQVSDLTLQQALFYVPRQCKVREFEDITLVFASIP